MRLDCIEINWTHYLIVYLAALGANQGTYLALIKPRKAQADAEFAAEMYVK